MIRQGDLYWINPGEPIGSRPGYRHPFFVVQNDVFNQSRIRTVVICALRSNLRLATSPGNVLLDLDPLEANLPKRSVVNVTQIATIDREQLEEKVGSLSYHRVRQILDGIRPVLESVIG